MKNEFEEDQRQFKLPATDEDEEPAVAMATDVDELRLEKISQRVTFISILIPVLIIIVLVIAYLDIKKRMSYTEDTGTMEFRKLSSDLESRFSSLSLRQAKLEESLDRFSNTLNQSLAGSNIKIDKLAKTVGAMPQQFVAQKDFNQTREELTRQINELSAGIDQVDGQISNMTQELKNQIAKIGDTFSERNLQIEQLGKRISDLDNSKIDKPGLDLAIKLATLKVEQNLLAQTEKIMSDLLALSAKVSRLSAAPPSNVDKSAQPSPEPTKTPPVPLEEEPIK